MYRENELNKKYCLLISVTISSFFVSDFFESNFQLPSSGSVGLSKKNTLDHTLSTSENFDKVKKPQLRDLTKKKWYA